MAAKKENFAVILPPDLFFYMIPLNASNQYLTREDLEPHYPAPKGRKVYMGNNEKVTSFENGIAVLETHLSDQSENTIYLHVEPNELHIACSCGMPGEKLCFHAFMVLYRLCWQSEGFDFGQLYWPGFDIKDGSRKFLDIEYLTYRAIRVKSKPEYGLVYRKGLGFLNQEPPEYKQDKRLPSVNTGNKAVIAYALCYISRRHAFTRQYPLLMPLYGMTAKDGLKVNSFLKFILPDQPTAIAYPPMHRELSDIVKAMYMTIKPLHDYGTITDEDRQLAKINLFQLWENALPFLSGIPYTYSYPLYWLKRLKERPFKAMMKEATYSRERPALTFDLTFHKDHFTLKAVVTAGCKIIDFDYKPHFFVIDKNSGYCYMMNSIQDDDLLNWMMDNGNKITFLKADFQEVDFTFLNKLHEPLFPLK